MAKPSNTRICTILYAAIWAWNLLGFSAFAWLTSSSNTPLQKHTSRLFFSLGKSEQQQQDITTRRQWFASCTNGAAILLASSQLPQPAQALQGTPAICDDTVSVWERNGRQVFLLGTAHISTISAQLAGALVDDVRPEAVFVELDLKRVAGISSILVDNNGEPSKLIVPDISQALASTTTTFNTDDPTSTTATALMPQQQPSNDSKKFSLRQSVLQASAAAVGNSIRGMYKKLDSQGFRAGEEFTTAIRQGQKVGSVVVLGDQDVEVTLRRLTQALAATDLSTFLAPDSELEQTMKELMPQGQQSLNSKDDANFQQDMSVFVETIKTKQNVQKLMTQLQKIAPEIYNAMVAERDVYMALGLDTLNQFPNIVAVMGLAHVDGVERNLRQRGWKQVMPTCVKTG